MNKKKIKIKSYLIVFLSALIITISAVLIIFLYLYFSKNKTLQEKDKLTAALINCNENRCDIFNYVNYPKDDVSDFIITKDGFLIDISNEFTDLDLPFNYVDLNFIKKFLNKPKVYESITGEKWLLYSEGFNINNNDYYLMTALALDVPWRVIKVKPENYENILVKETKNLISQINSSFKKDNNLEKAINDIRPKIDAFQLVDKSGRVKSWNWGIPSFVAKEKIAELENWSPTFVFNKGKIFVINKLTKEGLYFVSIDSFIDVKILLLIVIVSLLVITTLINILFRKQIIRSILIKNIPDLTLEDALKRGEDELIEFKSKKSLEHPETLLKSIVSLANSGGGVIFIGVNDDATIEPFVVQSIKEIDNIKLKITNYIKEHINPTPDVLIETINLSDNSILLKIKIIPSFDPIVYSFNGIFYRRLGNSDIPMDFWTLQKILSNF